MTIEQIKEMVNGSAYDFLRTNEHLGSKIIFLTLGGSYSYGTNVETSDVDVRGCALNSESDLLGLTSFEQVVNTQTDTTILTSKESREFYFLYELVDGEFKKLGKARTPKELEDKFEVSKKMRCAQ